MGPQFAHVQTFSRKPNKAGQSVSQVFGELLREALFSLHVSDPSPVQIVDGIRPDRLQAEHDAMIRAAKSKVRTEGNDKERAIRLDRHTLATAVASYPIPLSDIIGDPIKEKALRDWEDANTQFFRKFFGTHYRATYRHVDETYPHIHVYALPTGVEGVDAQLLHPGKAAKKEAEAKAKQAGHAPREIVAIGNRALKSAMREWQDWYYREVGEPCGLLRTGPKRLRLSRAQYMANQADATLRSTSTLAMRQALLDQAGVELRHNLSKFRADKKALDDRISEIARKEAAHKHREEQFATAVQILKQAGERVHRIIKLLATFLGLENAGKLEDILQSVEDAVAENLLDLQNATKTEDGLTTLEDTIGWPDEETFALDPYDTEVRLG